MREIKFEGPITSACFLNLKADILVAHGGKISVIYAADYRPFEEK